MHYFARVTAGLEEIAWLDVVTELDGAELDFLSHRQIRFRYSGYPPQLLNLRSVDDVYCYVATVPEIGHRHASLDKLRVAAAQLQLDGALSVVHSVRGLGKPLSFYVTASYLGSRNYSRHDIQDAVQTGILQNHDWKVVDSSDLADIDVRVAIEGEEATIGVRLQAWPLHRRPYKIRTTPGSLKPPVAYCLGLFASLEAGDSVIDPFCGSGTIGLEIAHTLYRGRIMNGDVDEEAIHCARTNQAQATTVLTPSYWRSDAGKQPLRRNSVTKVVSNLPWGRQVQVEGGLADLYRSAVHEIRRILLPGGRAVLLTDRSDLLLENAGDLELAFARQISLYGSYPTLHVLDYRRPQSAPAFPATTAFTRGLNRLIEREGKRQPYTPLTGKLTPSDLE